MNRFPNFFKQSSLACGLFAALGFAQVASSQSQDIMILPLMDGSDGKYVSLEPTHVTQREGYDNQPKFGPKGDVLYFTRMLDKKSGDGQQSDIFKYQLSDGSFTNITQTEDISEYSATPFSEGFISVVAVNPEGQQHLRLVSTVNQEQKVLREDIEPVGYYGWLSSTKAGVFVLGDTMTLQILDTESSAPPLVIADNIGRCFETVAPGLVTFTIEEEGVHQLYALNHEGGFTSAETKLPEGVQDYAWFDQTHVVVGQDSKLLLVNAAKTKELVDLKKLGVSGITRLALSPDRRKVAIVYERAE